MYRLQCPLCGIIINPVTAEKMEHLNFHFIMWMTLVAKYDFDIAGPMPRSIEWLVLA